MIRNMIVGMCYIAVLAVGWSAEAAAKKTYNCYRLAEPVVIDGKLDDSAWKHIPKATGFFVLPTSNYSTGHQTEFQMGWDDKALYLAIRCLEPDVAKLASLSPEKRAGEMLEIFFMPEKPSYFQLMADLNGKVPGMIKYRLRMQNKIADVPTNDIRVATAFAPDCWTMEIAIPFTLFDKMPEGGTSWGFNIGRDSVIGQQSNEWLTTWAYLPRRNYHDYNEYGILRFAGGTPKESEAEEETQRINEAYFATVECMKDLTRRQTELHEKLANATSLTFTGGMRSSSDFDLKRPLLDELRGMRYYGVLPMSIEFSWPKPVSFNACKIIWESPVYMAKDYGLEFWDGNTWQLILHDDNNTSAESESLFELVTADKVRLTVFASKHGHETLRIRTFDLYNLERK